MKIYITEMMKWQNCCVLTTADDFFKFIYINKELRIFCFTYALFINLYEKNIYKLYTLYSFEKRFDNCLAMHVILFQQ